MKRRTPVDSGVRVLYAQDYTSSEAVCGELVSTAFRVHNINRRTFHQRVELGSPILHLDHDQHPMEIAKGIGKALSMMTEGDFATEPDILYVDGQKASTANRNTNKAEQKITERAPVSGITVISLQDRQAHIIANETGDEDPAVGVSEEDRNESRDQRLKRLIEVAQKKSPVVFLIVPEIIDKSILEQTETS